MFLDWFTATGVVAVVGMIGVLMYMCRTEGCRKSPPKAAAAQRMGNRAIESSHNVRDPL